MSCLMKIYIRLFILVESKAGYDRHIYREWSELLPLSCTLKLLVLVDDLRKKGAYGETKQKSEHDTSSEYIRVSRETLVIK